MQVVIMAGGEGRRLRPLTCDRPKPLVPICGKPLLTYILEGVAALGVQEAWLTLGYMARAIAAEYETGGGPGLRLRMEVEPEPRGTAGGVAALPLAPEEPILVLSGDALTDFDLSALLAFHRERGSLVTLALARVPDPTPYGAVLTAPDGRVRRFLEKPTRAECFTDLVSAGIYVLEPEVLRQVPRDRPFDFARDLFPALLAAGVPMYGWEAGGYWRDIGDLEAYLQANLDLLEGRLRLRPPGREVAPGLWLDGEVDLEAGVEIRGPAYLGPGCRVLRGARLLEGVVLGAGSLVEPAASLKRTVLGCRCRVGRRAEIRGAVAGDGVRVEAGAAVYHGAALGTGARVAREAEVQPGVRIWPGRWVAPGALATRNLIWSGGGLPFAEDGSLEGRIGVDWTVEELLRYAGAAAAALPAGEVVVGADPGGTAPLIRELLVGGLRLLGRPVADLGSVLPGVTAWAVGHRRAAGGLQILRDGPVVRVLPLGPGGCPFGGGLLRKLEQAWRDQGAALPPGEPGQVTPWPGATGAYLASLRAELLSTPEERRRPALDLTTTPDRLPLLEEWAGALGFRLLRPGRGAGDGEAGGPDTGDGAAGGPDAGGGAAGGPAPVRAGIGALHPGWWLAGPTGEPLPEEVLQSVELLLACRYLPAGEPVPIPAAAPVALEAVCAGWGRRWRRVEPGEAPAEEPLRLLSRLLDHLALSGYGLAELLAGLPPVRLARATVALPWESRPRLLRALAEAFGDGAQPIAGGLRLTAPDGCTLTVLPVPHQPLCRIYAEAADRRRAEEEMGRLRQILGGLGREAQ
ncbi:MAG: NTP transferase domain-containing protein [Firmicutes bacterium]|nr:NTP transferase domain-containing protein [Bacillota bacterium]